MSYDILIKGGTVIDGTGRGRATADIGVKDGLIKDIAPSLGTSAEKVIPAAGHMVAPGFIDSTSHADTNWSLWADPTQPFLVKQGITTIVVGNCGSSAAPLIGNAGIEGLKKWENAESLNINWTSVAEYLAELERKKLGPNVALLVGHGTIRRALTKGESRPLTPDETKQLEEIIKTSFDEGAFGLSLGLIYSHEAAVTPEELAVMARVVADKNGLLKIHLRNEGARLIASINEILQLLAEVHVKTLISHLKAIGRKSWSSFPQALAMIDQARAQGHDLSFDISPYQRTGSFLYLLLPPWVREGGFGPMLGRLNDPSQRSAIVADLQKQTLNYDRYVIATSTIPGTNGKTIAELANTSSRNPAEVLFDLLLISEGRLTVFGKTLSLENVREGIRHPSAMIASDGTGILPDASNEKTLTHPRSTGAFPHFLHAFVREQHIISWEEAIKKITATPATTLGLLDRGTLEAGKAADIVVFDPEAVRDTGTYKKPYSAAIGVSAVVINGALALAENGAITPSGRVLKKPTQ